MAETRGSRTRDRREFIHVSVDFPEHPKLMSLDEDVIPLAGWLALNAWTYCGANLTDGQFIPNVVYRKAGVGKEIGKELIAIGLWHEAGHDCPKCPQPGDRKLIIHDFLQHQRSREEAEDLRSARAEAGAKGARNRWEKVRAAQQEKASQDAQHEGAKTSTEPDESGIPIASAIASATGGAMANAIANEWQADSNADGKPMAEVEGEVEPEELFPTPDGAGTSKRKTLDDHFAEFYSHYPLKKGRRDARTQWDAARKRASIAAILHGVERFAADPNLPADRSKIPWPERWLKGDRWDDDPYPAAGEPTGAAAAVRRDGSVDVDAVLGKDRWTLPTPPEHIQPGTPGYSTWARSQWEERHQQRRAEAESVIARRRSA